MKPIRKLVVSTGEYTDRNTGQTKKRWLRIGTLFKGEDGEISAKIDCIPTGEWSGWANAYPMDDEQSQPAQTRQPAPEPVASHQDSGDDIPF